MRIFVTNDVDTVRFVRFYSVIGCTLNLINLVDHKYGLLKIL